MTLRFAALCAFLLGLTALGHALYAQAEEDASPVPYEVKRPARTHLLVLVVDGEYRGARGPYTVQGCMAEQAEAEGLNTACIPAGALDEQREQELGPQGADEAAARSRRGA